MDRKTILKRRLDKLYGEFDLKYLSPDPLEFLHKFDKPEDIEIVGLIASSLAYGRVEGIRRSITKVMDIIGWKPFGFACSFDPKKDTALFEGFAHRFNTGRDIAALFLFIRQMIEGSGSIGAFFTQGYNHNDETIEKALVSFSERTLALDPSTLYAPGGELPKDAGVRYFFPSPTGKSACKRLNLYLRWMVRSGDPLDFGIWRGVSPAKLIIPLDTHIARISANIGLTRRKSADWRMAEEITVSLRELDPEDPVKYDFSLCRLGILDKCKRRHDPSMCEGCLLKEICIL